LHQQSTKGTDDLGVVGMYTTTSTREEADTLASLLVQRNLAACVQVEGPITSHYRWEGTVQTAEEWRLLVKTTAAAIPAVSRLVLEQHSYDEPEILFFPFTSGASGYVSWLKAEVHPETSKQ